MTSVIVDYTFKMCF